MTEFFRLLRVEIIKLLKHRLTWGVLVGLLLIMGAAFYDQVQWLTADPDHDTHLAEFQQADAVFVPTADLADVPADARGELLDAAFGAEAITPLKRWQSITLPGAFSQVQLMVDWFNLAAILLAIIAVGREVSWGTVQMVLVRGVPRGLWLWTKLGAITAVLTLYLLTLWLTAGIIGLIITSILTGQASLAFADGAFWLAQLDMLMRIWVVMVAFLAFVLAINIWLNKPGPAFSLLFLTFGLSWFAYISSSLSAVFALANPNFDMAAFNTSVLGRLVTLVPHYNGRLLLYNGAPHVLAELDSSTRTFITSFNLTADPTRALFILLLYGFIPFLLALRSFQNREISG
jgi:ABC-type transport system involved in multi-copper enzyme maturation permease subunit